jgi:hypothetical protein
LAQFSAANYRLAVENDKLRSGGSDISPNPSDAMHEMRCLRGGSMMLDSVPAQLDASLPSFLRTDAMGSGRTGSFTAQNLQAGYGIELQTLFKTRDTLLRHST